MKKSFLSLAFILALAVTGMAQNVKVVSSSGNTASQNETTQNSGGFWAGRPYIKGARFNAYLDLGLTFGGKSAYANGRYGHATLLGQQLSATLGVRIFDYGFVGVQVGLADFETILTHAVDYNGWYHNYNIYTINYPVMLDMRGFFPINQRYQPYIEVAYGWAPELVICTQYDGEFDFDDFDYDGWIQKLRIGTGIDIGRLSLGLGYARSFGYYENWSRDYFYMKVGVKLGRRE